VRIFPNLAKASGSDGIFVGARFLPDVKKNAGFQPEPNSGTALATSTIGDTFQVLVQVLAIVFMCSIDIGIGDTFSLNFWQYSISVLLLFSALVNFIENNTTVPERVKARTIVLHRN